MRDYGAFVSRLELSEMIFWGRKLKAFFITYFFHTKAFVSFLIYTFELLHRIELDQLPLT